MNQEKSIKELIKRNLFKYKRYFIDGIIATILINIFALATSLFSMQVYDRVIPTHGISTLVTLAVGVFIMIFFEFSLKLVRSRFMDSMVVGMDGILSRKLFGKLLDVKLDVIPTNIGSLASQLKSYESVRGFITSSSLYVLIDLPFALLYLFVIATLGSIYLVYIALFFFVLAFITGLILKKKIEIHTKNGAEYSNKRMGQLVETIGAMELIKSTNTKNRFARNWHSINRLSISNDLNIKHINENATYISQLFQSLGYITLVSSGAYLVVDGQMTMGALIACTIISGRMLQPIVALPGIFTQMAHAKAALKGLEALYALPSDFNTIQSPLKPQKLEGNYKISNLKYNYPNNTIALDIENLEIQKGKKIAILGAIGSGKSTLLKLLAGLYTQKEGNILIDNLDISHIDKENLSQNIAYVPQDCRLFEGTLKDNLLLNNKNITDDRVRDVANATGLLQRVLTHPSGFDLPIFEGGNGVSVGQRQLISISRVLLEHKNIWLFDEPTASLDGTIESMCVNAIKQNIRKEDTMIIVTHKPSMLHLVDEIIYMENGKILLYGLKNDVLTKLSSANQQRKQ